MLPEIEHFYLDFTYCFCIYLFYLLNTKLMGHNPTNIKYSKRTKVTDLVVAHILNVRVLTMSIFKCIFQILLDFAHNRSMWNIFFPLRIEMLNKTYPNKCVRLYHTHGRRQRHTPFRHKQRVQHSYTVKSKFYPNVRKISSLFISALSLT